MNRRSSPDFSGRAWKSGFRKRMWAAEGDEAQSLPAVARGREPEMADLVEAIPTLERGPEIWSGFMSRSVINLRREP